MCAKIASEQQRQKTVTMLNFFSACKRTRGFQAYNLNSENQNPVLKEPNGQEGSEKQSHRGAPNPIGGRVLPRFRSRGLHRDSWRLVHCVMLP